MFSDVPSSVYNHIQTMEAIFGLDGSLRRNKPDSEWSREQIAYISGDWIIDSCRQWSSWSYNGI